MGVKRTASRLARALGDRAVLGHLRRSVGPDVLPWLLAVAVIGAIYAPGHSVVSAQTAAEALLGLIVITLAIQRPDVSLILLLLLLPFSDFILSELYQLGVPAAVVRHASAWKELLASGVVLAGIRGYLAEGRRADALDRLAGAFIALIALYLVAQKLIVPGTASSLGTRALAFRQDAGFVLLLLGARHAPLPEGFLRRAAGAAVASAVIVAGVCVFETLDSGGWNSFVVNVLRYPFYETNILNAPPANLLNIRDYGTLGGATIIRPGSVFLSPLTCGFYLVPGFALTLERGIGRRGGALTLLWLLLIGAGILLTETRSAILAAVVVAIIAVTPSAGRWLHWRKRLTLFAIALSVGVIPVLASTSVLDRIGGSGNSADNSGHVSGFFTGVDTVGNHLLGLGLGTSAGIGQRSLAAGSSAVIPENAYLDVGVEAGVLAALIFAALTATLVLYLRNAARSSLDPVVSAAWAGAAGLAVAALFLQTWVDFSVSWSVWGLCGAALGTMRAPGGVLLSHDQPADVRHARTLLPDEAAV